VIAGVYLTVRVRRAKEPAADVSKAGPVR
jgi:hypothetical protein